MQRLIPLVLVVSPLLAAAHGAAPAQTCAPDWTPSHGKVLGTSLDVFASAVFDDGTGPALYAGGTFTSAGGTLAQRIARWNGSTWEALGAGIGGSGVAALAVFDDGTGPALYAAGGFATAGGVSAANIARWNGTTWSALGAGTNGGVRALAVWDDGNGPALYVGGDFTQAGGALARRLARWNGATWAEVGGGISDTVRGLTAHTDGSGSSLIAVGTFQFVGTSIPADRIARWNGSAWASVGAGMPHFVNAAVSFDDGSGPALYIGGYPPVGVRRWAHGAWTQLGTIDGEVRTLAVANDGTGPRVWAGGSFEHADGPAARIASWSGSQWSAAHTGMDWNVDTIIQAPGPGSVVFAGGEFMRAGDGIVNRTAFWDGASWSAVGRGHPPAPVHDLVSFDDGSGSALYACGPFAAFGGVAANGIARRAGSTWEPVGGGLGFASGGGPNTMVVHDEQGQPRLFVGGRFTSAGDVPATNVARWDGNGWSAVGNGLTMSSGPSDVRALASFQGELYAAGLFHVSGSTFGLEGIARFDGSGWKRVGAGLDILMSPTSPTVVVGRALAVFDDGFGPALFVGGDFTHAGAAHAGGIQVNSIARWNGTTWSSVVGGVMTGASTGSVTALAAYDLGSGPALYVGGRFTSAGGLSASRIARWNGQSWAALGPGVTWSTPLFFLADNPVSALRGYDDGTGPALYVGGAFSSAGGVANTNQLARWDGATWSAVGGGVAAGWAPSVLSTTSADVYAFAVHDDGSGDALFAGGRFTVSPAGDSFLAKWQGCPSPSAPVVLPGCLGNAATLSLAAGTVGLGRAFTIGLVGTAHGDGWALLFVGADGTDPSGCGLALPGFGDWLLAPFPGVEVGSQPNVGGATFPLAVPVAPALVGMSVTFQAAHVALFVPGTPLEFSKGLRMTVGS